MSSTAPAVEKEESSFQKWKKRFTSKSKPKVAEISASSGALTLIRLLQIHHTATQRTQLRMFQRWKRGVESIQQCEAENERENRLKQVALAQGGGAGVGGIGIGVSVGGGSTSGSGIANSLASLYGSPLSRDRAGSCVDQRARFDSDAGMTMIVPPNSLVRNSSLLVGGTRSPPQSPPFGSRTSEEHSEFGTIETTNPIPIQRNASLSISGVGVGGMSGSLPNYGTSPIVSAGYTPVDGSQSAIMPRRSIEDPNTSISSSASGPGSPAMPTRAPALSISNSVGGTSSASSGGSGGATPVGKHLAFTSPWTSARPIRPSIIAHRQNIGHATMPLPGQHGIHPALMSPTYALRSSNEGAASTGASIVGSSSNTSSSASSPMSPARILATASPPFGMQAHPRGSVMLGDIKEWRSVNNIQHNKSDDEDEEEDENDDEESSTRKVGGVRFDIETSTNSSASGVGGGGGANVGVGVGGSTPHSPLSQNRSTLSSSSSSSLVKNRWSSAVRQITALARWAKKRSISRQQSLAIQTHFERQHDEEDVAEEDEEEREVQDQSNKDDKVQLDDAGVGVAGVVGDVKNPSTSNSNDVLSTNVSSNGDISTDKKDVDTNENTKKTTTITLPTLKDDNDDHNNKIDSIVDTLPIQTSVVDMPSPIPTSPLPPPAPLVPDLPDPPKGMIPKSTLLDYFLVYALPDSSTSELVQELTQLSNHGGVTGRISRKQLDRIVKTWNDSYDPSSSNSQSAGRRLQPELLCRYPLNDRKNFRYDSHWCMFGFPDGIRISVTPRVTQCYSSVMTLADGLALFATYLKYDVPALPHLPHAFDTRAGGGGGASADSTSTSSSAGPKFWENTSPAGLAAAAAAADSLTPASPVMARSWSSGPDGVSSPTTPHHASTASNLYPQVYLPQCIVLISHYPQFEVLRMIAQQLFEVACLGGVSYHQYHMEQQQQQQHDATNPSSDSTKSMMPTKRHRTFPLYGTTLESYLRSLCFEIPLPYPQKFSVRFKIHRALCTIHSPGIRSTGQSQLNLDLLFRTLNVDNIIGVLSAILTENRILFHSCSLNMLTYVMQCFLQLLYPFEWWFTFVPQLGVDMLDAHEIPQPYMLGIHSQHLSSLTSLDSVLIVDLDHDVLRCSTTLIPLPLKDGRELWTSWRRSFEKIQVNRYDQVEDIRIEAATAAAAAALSTNNNDGDAISVGGSRSILLNHNQVTNHTTMPSNARRSSFSNRMNLTSSTSSTTSSSSSSSPIATMLPSSIFNFDEEIYSAVLRFYSDLLVGSRKFLFFISNVPFFNAQGFLAQRISRDPSSLEFFKAFVASRAFDVYIEEESNLNDPYHDYLATGTPMNRPQVILSEDFGTTRKMLEFPKIVTENLVTTLNNDGGVGRPNSNSSAAAASSSSSASKRVELKVTSVGEDEIVQAVRIESTPPSPSPSLMKSQAAAMSRHASLPFSKDTFLNTTNTNGAAEPTSIAPRTIWWSGLDDDRYQYDLSSSAPQPRKPKVLTSPDHPDHANGGVNSSNEGSYGIGETFSDAREGDLPGIGVDGATRPASSVGGGGVGGGSVGGGGSSNGIGSSGGVTTGPVSGSNKNKSSTSRNDTTGEHKLKHYLSQIFSSQTLSKDEMKDFISLLNDSTCRRTFANILSQPRQQQQQQQSSAGTNTNTGSGSVHNGTSGHSSTNVVSTNSTTSSSLCLTSQGFEQLSNLIRALLDSCLQSKDYISASIGGLDIGNVYYKEDPLKNHTRTYLEATMKKHRLWQQMEFWRANLTLALSQRAMKGGGGGNNGKSQNNNNTKSSNAASSASSSSSDDEFILQWMISTSHQMTTYSVTHRKIEELMNELSHAHSLSPDSRTTITHFISKIKEAAQYW